MANYQAFTRTNYFRVTNEDKLRELINSCSCGEDQLDLFEHCDDEGGKWFGFGAYGSISGLKPPEADPEECFDYDYDLFIDELQKILVADDAIIITEVGYEKLRYLIGGAMIITKSETRFVNLWGEAIKVARDLLQNSEFCTITEY